MKSINIFAVVLAGIAIIISLSTKGAVANDQLAQKVIDRGSIRIGYMVYPPLLIKDEKTGKLSGISYDLIEASAKKLNLKTEWTEEVGWGTAIEGLKTGRYDMLGCQMWPNSARAREALFSVAPMNSVLYPYVRAGDTRFSTDISKLNSASYKISVLDGEMSTFIAAESFPNAKLMRHSSSHQLLATLKNLIEDNLFAQTISPCVHSATALHLRVVKHH